MQLLWAAILELQTMPAQLPRDKIQREFAMALNLDSYTSTRHRMEPCIAHEICMRLWAKMWRLHERSRPDRLVALTAHMRDRLSDLETLRKVISDGRRSKDDLKRDLLALDRADLVKAIEAAKGNPYFAQEAAIRQPPPANDEAHEQRLALARRVGIDAKTGHSRQAEGPQSHSQDQEEGN